MFLEHCSKSELLTNLMSVHFYAHCHLNYSPLIRECKMVNCRHKLRLFQCKRSIISRESLYNIVAKCVHEIRLYIGKHIQKLLVYCTNNSEEEEQKSIKFSKGGLACYRARSLQSNFTV